MLIELLTVGRREDHFVVVALALQFGDTAVDRLALHNHACETAVWIVVNTPPFVGRVVAKVVQMYLCKTLLLRPGKY